MYTDNRRTAKMFVQATLFDGSKVVSEMGKLRGIRIYGAQVFAQAKAFNAWTIVSEAHPVTGERVLMRRLRAINGRAIKEMEMVQPKAGFEVSHLLDPENFEPTPVMQEGRFGLWLCPDDDTAPEGAVRGMTYPIHVDSESLGRFVYLSINPEIRYDIPVPVPGVNPGEEGQGRNAPPPRSEGEGTAEGEWDSEAWGDGPGA